MCGYIYNTLVRRTSRLVVILICFFFSYRRLVAFSFILYTSIEFQQLLAKSHNSTYRFFVFVMNFLSNFRLIAHIQHYQLVYKFF